MNKLEQAKIRDDYFRKLKVQLGVGSLAKISDLLNERGVWNGASMTHLGNIKRGERDANPQVIEALKDLAPELDPEVLGRSYAVTRLAAALATLNTVKKKLIRESQNNFGGQVQELFACLENNDLYVLFLTDITPAELTHGAHTLRKEFISALDRGAAALYVAPQNKEAFYDYEQVPQINLEDRISDLDKFSRTATKRIQVARTGRQRFMLPGFKFALYNSLSLERPAATFGAKTFGDTFVHLLLDSDIAESMCACVRSLDQSDWSDEVLKVIESLGLSNAERSDK